jgi:alpha-tubulin suppressor-like RCC1 family protein
LGDGGVTARSTPTLVWGGHEFTRISAGYRLSCAVTTSGVAYCWGENGHGEVGAGSTEYYAHWTATQVSSNVVGGLRFARLSGGNDHTCGLTSTGLAYCWGENSFGAMGDGTTIARHVPSMVAGGFLFKEISTGALHTCALQTDGQALCWGNNRIGQLGDGTITDHTEAAAVSGTLSFAKIATGSEHSCAIASGGAVYCWGNNDHGQLGDGSVVAHYAPTLLPGPYAFREIAAGKSHTCALTLSGAAYCWGNWGVTETHTPELVPAAGAFVELEAGDRTTCGTTTANNVLCWGINANGQLADGTTSTVLTPTSGQNEDGALLGIPFGGLSVGGSHACFLAQPNSTAYCSGWNYYGQLGDNTTVERHLAVSVYGTFAFQSITAGGNHTCALSSGAAYCWGRNEQGQLGNDETSERHAPAWVTRLLFRTY